MPELCVIDVPEGVSLQDILFEQGVEFPCGGTSVCGGCRVRVVQGDIAATAEMRDALSDEEIAAGWRLACRARVRGRIVLDIGQWNAPILSDEARIESGAGRGLAVAVDVGTTTLVAQLVDLATGEIHGVRTALNPQSAHGADIMSRIDFDLRSPGVLTRSIRSAVGAMVQDLSGGQKIAEVLLAGNTVMHHLFCGISVEPLSHVPFTSANEDTRVFSAPELNWQTNADCTVTFLPCIGGFVGSDILAGMVAVGLLASSDPIALIDLGTNGEIVIGNRDGAVCASTAAGPAFEAGRIRMGMRAAPGAIDRVAVHDGRFVCHVIGGSDPRGICGSGLVDAIASGLAVDTIGTNGRLRNDSKELILREPVRITQADIRELQLAKAAIAAGFRILRNGRNVSTVHLAGAFGNYVNVASAIRIGLLEMLASAVAPAGNTALRGVKVLLSLGSRREAVIDRYLSNTRHVSLACDPAFQEIFAESMSLRQAE